MVPLQLIRRWLGGNLGAMRSEMEYSGYWVEVWVRSRLGRCGLEYAAEVRVTADSDEAARRRWMPLIVGEPPGFALEVDALENGMRRGFDYVDTLRDVDHG